MKCLSCDEPLSIRKMARKDDGPSVAHWSGSCKCGEPVSMTVRRPSRPANPAPEAKGVGLRYMARGFGGTVVS